MQARIYFLDNLRTFMILLVIVLHSAIGYTSFLDNQWIVSDPSKNSALGLVVLYLDIFVMFIMFFISGYFIPRSYNNSSTWALIVSKFRRIMIPWLVAVFTVIPLYKFIFLYSRGLPQQEWYSYFHLFSREGGNMGFFADNPTQSWLWFLPVLFIFQVAYVLLAKSGILRIKISLHNAVIFTFSIGFIYSLLISAMDMNGWFDIPILHFQRERLLSYFLFFLLGSLCYKLKVFESPAKNSAVYITSYAVLTLSLIAFTIFSMNYFQNIIEPGRDNYVISETADWLIYYTSILLAALSFLYIFIRIFKATMNRSGKISQELSRNSYSVYIIHMIVIGVFMMMLLHINIPATIKFIIVTMLTFILSNMLVSGYRIVFGKIFANKYLAYAMVTASILLSIIVYAQEENIPTEAELTTSQYVPGIGIHEAAMNGDTTAIKHYINAGTNLNEKDAMGGSSPLIIAVLLGRIDIAIMLIKAGADVDQINNEGSTALITAAFFCRIQIVESLLAHAADKNIRNASGSTAYESVVGNFEDVKGIYDYLSQAYAPLGLELDYEHIRASRPILAEMLNDK